MESVPCHFKILLAPRGEGPGKGAIFGDLSTLTLNLTQPRKRLGTHLRSDMSSCHLSDLMQVVNSVPGPVLDMFIHLPRSKLALSIVGCNFGTLTYFQKPKGAPQKANFQP